ncbi:MAG: sodium:proton antiporter, partial [Verrucomicrobiota bacterium]
MMPALDWLQGNANQLGAATPSLFFWGTGILSSVLDNAPTYLSFLSAAFGLFIDADTIRQVEQLVRTNGAGLAALSGPNAEAIRLTFETLQKYHGAALTAGNISTEQIEIAFLLGNTRLNQFIVAISIGAVFFGANTYIGNGPNFLVKSIADHFQVHTPGFLGFVFKFTLPIMVPVLLVTWWMFFRG